jgi:hypothetical protein
VVLVLRRAADCFRVRISILGWHLYWPGGTYLGNSYSLSLQPPRLPPTLPYLRRTYLG